MRILLFHPTRLPPKDYGGIERVVLWLARGLLERGHEVHVAAHPGSVLPEGARLLEIDPEESSPARLSEKLPPGIELVHFMAPPGEGAMRALGCPSVVTVHGNGKPGEKFSRDTIFLSADHARRHGAEAFVYNGVDPSEYRFEPRSKGDHLIFLSKTSWRVKNVRGAIRICARARARLKVAGGNRPVLSRARVAASRRMKWVGPVAGLPKAEFLARARAMVFPVLWDEPFGLVVAEAMISGTPVLVPGRGSLPELVPPEAGLVLPPPEKNERAWIDAVARVSRREIAWDPERCREWALSRFHYAKMAESYEEMYRRVQAGERLNPVEPQTQERSEG
jgi:glycosyltransferase involved in cell wall biosynthesis